MARVSNVLISVINIIFLIVGLVALSTGVYIHIHDVNHCQKLMQNPVLIMGFFLIVTALIGLLGLCFKDNSLLMIYLGMIFFLIVGLTIITIFAFLVTHKGPAGSGFKENPRLGFQEYRLEDFSKWLQKYVGNKYHWDKIKNCLIDAQVCKGLGQTVNQIESDFLKMKLTPLQAGCCKPPISCNLQYLNATSWTVPRIGLAKNSDTDCMTWNNNQNMLCYDCNSCKGGFAAKLRNDSKVFAVYNVLTISFLMLTYFIGCCARRNIKYRYVKYSPYV